MTQWQMSYDIAVGVRRDDEQLRQRLDAGTRGRQPAIDALLRGYHIPRRGIPHASVAASPAAP